VIVAFAGAVHPAESDTPIIEIVPPREAVGERLRIHTLVTSESIESVDFVLDGRLLATDDSFPFSLRIATRSLASARQLEAVAFDGHGRGQYPAPAVHGAYSAG